jgi:chemosensory pili system protein ChpA (sensor histidine kinase/response regulator)
MVMVVDDSVTVRKVTSRLLERHGYEVVLAKDGLDAITKLEDIRPDIMLLDIEMPRMDGFEVASLVRHNPNLVGLPIIMITSRTGEKHRERAFQIGVNAYMGKPFQEQQLLETIAELLGSDREIEQIMTKRNPRVAIVSDMSLQRLALAHAVKGQGYDLVLNTLSRAFG